MESETSPLRDWVCGLFDAEGSINTPIAKKKKYSTGYGITPEVRMNHTYTAGFFDGEGSLAVRVEENAGIGAGYRVTPLSRIRHSKREGEDPVAYALKEYCDRLDIECNVYDVERDGNGSDQFCWVVTGKDSVSSFLESIRDKSIVKREQIDIMLDEIIPLMENGTHLNEAGFLEVMEKVDEMNSHKGGTRGKYDHEYFKDEFGETSSMESLVNKAKNGDN